MVEVCYVNQTTQQLVVIPYSIDMTVEQAIVDSGLLQQCPEINLSINPVGIFSKKCALSDTVKPGDRIEIYRPLVINPKEARRLRAKRP
jgi:uncharacterized protein